MNTTKENTWFEMKAGTSSGGPIQSADDAEIFIYDTIGSYGVSAKQFVAQLQTLKAKKLKLRIHSPGGGIFDGNAIYNAIRQHPAQVETFIEGLAASMASLIALAGKPVHMAANGMYMIHNPSSIVWGGSSDLQHTAELLDKLKENSVNMYREKTGLPRQKISDMMDAETWMTATEAKELGFVDVVTGEFQATASYAGKFDLSRFQNAPAKLGEKEVGPTEHNARVCWAYGRLTDRNERDAYYKEHKHILLTHGFKH